MTDWNGVTFAQAATVSGQSRSRRGRVLIIDDEPALLRAFGRIIGRVYDVITARDGVTARDAAVLDGAMIDVVLCDILVGNTNGIELYQALTEIQPELANRFTFMSGGGLSPDLVARIHDLGCPMLDKPLEPDDVIRHIAQRLARGADPASESSVGSPGLAHRTGLVLPSV